MTTYVQQYSPLALMEMPPNIACWSLMETPPLGNTLSIHFVTTPLTNNPPPLVILMNEHSPSTILAMFAHSPTFTSMVEGLDTPPLTIVPLN